MNIDEIKKYLDEKFETLVEDYDIDVLVTEITKKIKISSISVADRVEIAHKILQLLTKDQRQMLCEKILQEQVLDQRKMLLSWSTLTGQGAQIDTGYIAQHLVSLITQIPGQGMRGKGDDLVDKSEIKSANFLDSLDKKGATAPRWNFTAGNREIAERFLEYKVIYLTSFDLNEHNRMRFRVWKIIMEKHDILKDRYKQWLIVKAYPKFENNNREGVNFQLFPPTHKKNENFARHGSNRGDSLPPIKIPLEDYPGSKLIFFAEQDENDKIKIINFN